MSLFGQALVPGGVPWTHLHRLRHKGATWLIEADVPLREIARMLGDTEGAANKRCGKHAPDCLGRGAERPTEPRNTAFFYCGRRPGRSYEAEASVNPLKELVLLDRIELSTSPLPRECSTTELQQRAAWGERGYATVRTGVQA